MAERRGGNLEAIDGGLRERIRVKYMEGVSPSEIEKELGVNANTIYTWIRRDGWKEQRATMRFQAESDAIIVRAHQTNRVLKVGFDVLGDLVQSFKKTPPTLDEGLKLIKLMAEINKINRINEGRPTEVKAEHRITENREFNTESEMRDVINADPFIGTDGDEA